MPVSCAWDRDAQIDGAECQTGSRDKQILTHDTNLPMVGRRPARRSRLTGNQVAGDGGPAPVRGMAGVYWYHKAGREAAGAGIVAAALTRLAPVELNG